MDCKILARRRNNTQTKTNNDVTPSKIRRKDINLEQLTKQKIIEKYKKLEEEYKSLVSLNENNDIVSEILKTRVKELEREPNKSESRAVQIQTVDMTDDPKFTCNECIHTANCEKALKWHTFHVHNRGNPEILMNYSCNTCHQKFHQKSELMSHIKKEHIESLAICKFFKEGECNFSGDDGGGKPSSPEGREMSGGRERGG